MNKISLNQLASEFTANNYVLMVGLGFDQRCLSVVTKFPVARAKKIVGISNAGWSEFNRKNICEFQEKTGGSSIVVGSNAKSVLEVADELNIVVADIAAQSDLVMVIDVTSLSHELLVVLLGILNSHGALNRVTMLYVGAAEYSVNSSETQEVWLSRGVRSIRSILGFPGTMYPSKKLHLIVLAGFEVDRAKEVITRYEPSSLSIGKGARDQSVSHSHHQNNQMFFSRLNLFIKEQDAYNYDVQHFEFSCVDPLLTKSQILEHITKMKAKSDDNIVICPLNTKLSTVGVALAALEDQTIQICYAEPEEYNTEGYSRPSDEVTIIQLG